jgi:UDP-MurNAc hydroxylase
MTSIGHAGILVETGQATIVCDPWFLPAFFGSWFVFPRNDRLPDAVMAKVERPDFLYISHLHADHFDEAFLADHISRDTTVLLPDFPTSEMEQLYRRFGFTRFVRTEDAKAVEIAPGLQISIHVQTSLTDGPGGDSALLVDDGSTRLLNMNDCRLHDLSTMGPIDALWLQFSGAIWYPMVYEVPEEDKRRQVKAKVESQFARAISYVHAIGARAVVPSAGPPCFLDEDLWGNNVITGDELSIFPDATEFERRLRADGVDTCRMVVPGSCVEVTEADVTVTHADPDWRRPFDRKLEYLREYQQDWASWLTAHKAGWHAPSDTLLDEVRAWWEPLLAAAPSVRKAIGANALLTAGDLPILIDFPNGQVRRHAGEAYAYSFTIPRELVETVVARRAVDWSNALFLSCRFTAWREGGYKEELYNFFKSLSPERMARAEAQAAGTTVIPQTDDEVTIGSFVVERFCPHRQADLGTFGELDGDGCTMTCTLHGWKFDLRTGACLNAPDRPIRVRPA